MFAAGRQLQQLQRFEVVASEYAQADADFEIDPEGYLHDLQSSVEFNASLLQADSLNVGPGDLAKLTSCCPRLCNLQTICQVQLGVKQLAKQHRCCS
jgi:hypothetical protein